MRKTVKINRECLTDGHDWDWWGHPNLICNRRGCHVRGDDYKGIDMLSTVLISKRELPKKRPER